MEKTLVLGSKLQNDELRPREESGKLYKYELPVVNEEINFRSKAALVKADEKETLTFTEKLFEALECDKDTAYESFVIKHQQAFNNEVDMYGDIRRAGDVQLRVLEFGVPIPYDYITDEETMKRTRAMFRVNFDIPGAIEAVHPNKFLPSKCFQQND
jgi:hypothetical protein